jgi:hypothetical protein
MRQANFYQIGLSGCYLDCIVHLAEDYTKTYIDLYAVYLKGLVEKTIGADCFVFKPDVILSNLTKTWWTFSKEDLAYLCQPAEYEITRYEWQEPSLLHGHFVVTDGAGLVLYDPFGKSATVVNGKPVSKRIFRRT